MTYKQTYYTQIIPLPFCTITVTLAVGLDVTTSSLFSLGEDEEEVGKILSVKGSYFVESSMFEGIFDNDFLMDSTLLNLIKIFNNKVNDVLLKLSVSTDTLSLTISRSLLNNYVILTFRYYDEITHVNFFEIEIKIELIDNWVYELVLASQHVFWDAMLKIADFSRKYERQMKQIIIAMCIFPIAISAAVVTAGPAIVTAYNSIAAAQMALMTKLANAFVVPLIQPVVQLIKVPG